MAVAERPSDEPVVPIAFEESETHCLVSLEGEIDIASAAELKRVLLQALAAGKDLRIDLERASELHITAFQLLWAAERKASGSPFGFSMVGRLPEKLSEAAIDAGLGRFPVPLDET